MPPENRVVEARRRRRPEILAGATIVVAIAAVYLNSLAGPFVFDDTLAITENPTIRRLWPLTAVLFPPHGEGHTVEGRPVLNLTLALNYAFGGTSVRGYHAVNIIVHALAALTLFGLTRRTLLLSGRRGRFGAATLPLAWITALLWSLHPLQTESVTYIVQRAESLVSLFYLLTLYCFVRGIERDSAPTDHATTTALRFEDTSISSLNRRQSRVWFGLAFAACSIGMATKEVMVSAPLLVLLFDRVFVAGNFRDAWRRRGAVHLALFSTWLLLGALALKTGTRGGTAGFGINVTPWAYALTQFEAVTRYVSLAFWPYPLIFDYGVAWVQSPLEVLPFALVLLALVGGTALAWRRWPAAAFLGTLFFAVLSPTSSIVPGNRQTLAEHRMYLPLAAIVVFVGCGLYLAAQSRKVRRPLFAASVVLALGLGAMTVARNQDYRSELVLYRDTVAKRPGNGFARYNLGKAYAETGRHADAVQEYEACLRIMPDVAAVHYNLANSLAELGRFDDARAHYETALRLDPNYVNADFNLGNLLLRTGDKAGALRQFQAVVSRDPQRNDARENLGGVLLDSGRIDEAKNQFEQVLRVKPDSVEAHFGIGNVFILQERWRDAVREFETVVALRPDLAVARDRLELARSRAGH